MWCADILRRRRGKESTNTKLTRITLGLSSRGLDGPLAIDQWVGYRKDQRKNGNFVQDSSTIYVKCLLGLRSVFSALTDVGVMKRVSPLYMCLRVSTRVL